MSGGKSLELMQRRMANGQPAPPGGGDNPVGGNPNPNPSSAPQAPFPGGQEVGGSPQQHINMNPRPGKSSSALMATQAREQGSQQHPLPSLAQAPPVGPPGGRPKGKDFAAMTMSKPSPSGGPAPQELPPQQQQQQLPPPPQMPPNGGGGAGRPKGKDFGAMASRMGNSAPISQQQQQPQPQHHMQQQQQSQHLQPNPVAAVNLSDADAQRRRAQQMQAAARAAAGLPPLDHYTATSVTTVPPPITTTKPQPQARTPTLYAQQRECFVWNLVARGTVDEWVDSLLVAKRLAAQLAQADIDTAEYEAAATYDFGRLIATVLGQGGMGDGDNND